MNPTEPYDPASEAMVNEIRDAAVNLSPTLESRRAVFTFCRLVESGRVADVLAALKAVSAK